MGPIKQNLVRHTVQDLRSNPIWLHDCLRVFLHNGDRADWTDSLNQ